jgi:hypothetical protein
MVFKNNICHKMKQYKSKSDYFFKDYKYIVYSIANIL